MSRAKVKEAVSRTVARVERDPSAARLTYRVQTDWVEAMQCTATTRRLPPLIVDEPASFGGTDAGMSPVDLVLSALGTCQEVMYSATAALMDIPLERVRVKVTGRLDLHGLLGLNGHEEVPAGLQDVRYETEIDSSASEADLARLVAAVEARCPVLDTLQRGVPVTGRTRVRAADASYRELSVPAHGSAGV